MFYSVKRQLTIALENQPGKLASICQFLAANQINIEAISVIDNIEQGVVRLVTSAPNRCRDLLHELDVHVIEADILALELTDQVGTLARIANDLAEAGVNIDYLYGSSDHAGTPARLILKVSDVGRASGILAKMQVP